MQKICFQSAKDLSYSSGNIHFNFNTAIITGVCRSGKTTLGNLLATAPYVENAEEPWTATNLSMMTGLGLIDERAGKEMCLNFLTEMFNDMILLRKANFRPKDLSSIWNQKSGEEIFSRLTDLYSRGDVKEFISDNSPLLLLNLAEILPFIDFFLDVLPETKLIHVVRKGLDVASDCYQKHWFSDEQVKLPIKAFPYSTYKFRNETWYLPWWVSRDEEELFLSYSEYERCVYYWCQLIQSELDRIDGLVDEGKCIVIRYEELIKDPRKSFDEAAYFLNIKSTPLTEMAIAKVKSREEIVHDSSKFKVVKELRNRLESIYSRLSY